MKKLLNRLFSRMVITCLLVAAQLIFFMVEVFKLQQYYVLVAAILHLLSFIAVMHLLLKDVNPSIKLAWIVPILMFPVLGGLLYLLYGHIIMPKKLEKYMKHAAEWDYETDLYANMAYFSDVIKGQQPYRLFKYTEDYAGSLVYQNTDVRYYPMGEDVWPDFVDDLKEAKKYIFLEYFIINPGEMWDTVLDILKEKVKEGVEVRLIYDDIGSVFYVPKYYWREMGSYGIKCMAFNQVVPFLATIFNNRDHRKIAVMDGKVAYTGGFNLSDEYINKKAPYGKWKDNGIRMEGDAAWRFTILFLQLWNSIRNEDKHILNYRPTEQKKHLNDGYLQPYTTNPLKKEPIGENIYMQMINDAREYVYIFTQYLIVCNEMMTALKLAAKRGIDVRIVTPAIPDKKMIFRMTQSSYKELLRAGVKIYQYTPGFIHSKCILTDDNLTSIGSINMDNRSFYHHFECGVLVYDSSIIAEVKYDMVSTMKESEEITLDWCKEHMSRITLVDAFLRLLSPLL